MKIKNFVIPVIITFILFVFFVINNNSFKDINVYMYTLGCFSASFIMFNSKEFLEDYLGLNNLGYGIFLLLPVILYVLFLAIFNGNVSIFEMLIDLINLYATFGTLTVLFILVMFSVSII